MHVVLTVDVLAPRGRDLSTSFLPLLPRMPRNSRLSKCPRFASISWLHKLRDEIEQRLKLHHTAMRTTMSGRFARHRRKPEYRLSAHLCGEYCVNALRGELKFIKSILHEQLG